MSLELYGTPRSHFTRIVRIVCHELDVDYRWIDVGNVAEAEPFGANPLMQVPVLVDEDLRVFDSHHICCYLVQRQKADPLGINALSWTDYNMLTVIRGVMHAEVRLVLAERCGMELVGGMFDKTRATLRHGLSWINDGIEEHGEFDYLRACAIAMWDHLLLYNNAEKTDAPRLRRILEQFNDRPSITQTRPS
ncbi:MAG: glutathione S-transferase family protein [Myxococcales bacterium]|nr:MAG: glutathione S-transferase family protein [Myxococcales bacterium]